MIGYSGHIRHIHGHPLAFRAWALLFRFFCQYMIFEVHRQRVAVCAACDHMDLGNRSEYHTTCRFVRATAVPHLGATMIDLSHRRKQNF